MPTAEEIHWRTDDSFFLSVPGGREVVDWFEFVPSFHDATLERLELTSKAACLVLRAFRMTDQVDSKGYFVLDKHALVSVRFSGVTGIQLEGESGLIISDLGVRRLSAKPNGWDAGSGPEVGDFEVAWDSCWGFDGAIFARDITLELHPVKP